MWLEGWIMKVCLKKKKVWFVGISDRLMCIVNHQGISDRLMCIVNHQEGIQVTSPKLISLYRATFSLSI